MSEIQDAKWYVVHTYSGHENKVKATIENTVKNRGMEDYIKQVIVPTEDVIETTKTGKEKVRQRKIYPSYVLINMIITDESWYIVRNTKGVTGFVGPGSKPVPLSEEEVKSMGIDLDKIGEKRTEIEVGEVINVRDGLFKGQSGIVKEIDLKNETVKVCMNSSTGNEVSLELDLKSIETI
ncbi:MAG: transcription termination/antitermination protein NusG [Clostridiales bacterium]|jgi:transcriptional antiterminator NusG|uniref:transcription termination/antitermination protein NusG n=1 Tax=Clostridia TaxID=186801 RepID=UPI0018A9A6EA|nr:transcription termination/antitermination protein NusG [Clostridium sp. 1001270J_160509_D11]MDU1204030.1 transcription termination/antitermination protein NusG [Clostridiales bacterium]